MNRSVFPAALLLAQALTGPARTELRFSLHADPQSFNPLTVSQEPDEIVSYLTGGVLIRMNRLTQKFEPELAESWKIREGNRAIEFRLRQGVRFSDGFGLTPADVAYTLRMLLDPKLHAPAGDLLRSDQGPVTVYTPDERSVLIVFPAPRADIERLFDQIPVVSARSLEKSARPAEMPVLGPYRVAEYRPGAYLLLARNPNYWKKDAAGTRLPYIGSIRLSIQQNRDLELIRFRRGEIHLINSLDAESFERLAQELPRQARDAGPSLEGEQMWFNQVARAPLEGYRKEWFSSREFRLAVSSAINRDDIVRVVFQGRATPAVGPVSPANRFWVNSHLEAPVFDPEGAVGRLKRNGFKLDGRTLRDRYGNVVEFSLITNSGNKSRERVAAMIQQDLAHIGIRLNVVTLDFNSLIERITRTFRYETCLLGLVNVDLDPSAQMNIWLSSATDHAWNPAQPVPETAWETEIDKLMHAQAAEVSPQKRKALFDRVQAIVVEESPVVYLVDKHALSAISDSLVNASPAVLHPQTFWNIERLSFRQPADEGGR